MAYFFYCQSKSTTFMKILNKQMLILAVVAFLFSVGHRATAQILLLDSLHGTWTMIEQYNNKTRMEPKGTIEFTEDGRFRSKGSYFGSTEGLYTTDETKSTIQIELNGTMTEWTASIRNNVLRMTRLRKKKSPKIELVLLSERAEHNSGT